MQQRPTERGQQDKADQAKRRYATNLTDAVYQDRSASRQEKADNAVEIASRQGLAPSSVTHAHLLVRVADFCK